MNTQNLIRNLLLASLSASWAGLVVAQDAPFTIQVPVDLRDMHPDVQGGEISCQVEDGQGATVAGGKVSFSTDRRTRSFNNTIPVSAQLAGGRSPLDARKYQCVLWLIDGPANMRSLAYAPGVQSDAKFEALSGTPFTPIVSGPIPSSLPGISAPKKPIPDSIKPR